MEAKDTVMSIELQNQLDRWLDLVVDVIDAKRKRRISSGEAVLFINWIEDGIALISFKAGIREVVEWMRENGEPQFALVGKVPHPKTEDDVASVMTTFELRVTASDWQAKLKEWGIE